MSIFIIVKRIELITELFLFITTISALDIKLLGKKLVLENFLSILIDKNRIKNVKTKLFEKLQS